jgi:hypothetical protein
MHPCREYWGQDVAYGSLVTGERPRRADRTATLTEIWILDTRVDAPATGHAELAGLMRRIGGLDTGEESLRQSAAHLKAFRNSPTSTVIAPGFVSRQHLI